VSRAFVELIRRLPRHGVVPVVLSRATRNRHLVESGLVPEAPLLPAPVRALSWASWRAVGRPRTTPRPLPELDVLHHTFTHPAYLGMWDGPRVVTVHDMTPELFPESFPLGNPHFAKRRYTERSDAIIAISQNTADDMFRLYGGGLEERTTVIPHGVDARFFEPSGRDQRLPERYVLFIGVRGGYKDFPTAVHAVGRVAETDADLAFVVVGGGAFTTTELRLLEAGGLAGRTRHVTPSDEQLPEIYARAAAFVFPSRYEGFGLPTLEALASGTPTVLADASSSREVGGGAARYFPPGDVDALVAELTAALGDGARKSALEAGPRRAARFDWDEAARRTSEVYRRIARR
jgi:glycosyltransferase involved in cell wall biosynthesis